MSSEIDMLRQKAINNVYEKTRDSIIGKELDGAQNAVNDLIYSSEAQNVLKNSTKLNDFLNKHTLSELQCLDFKKKMTEYDETIKLDQEIVSELLYKRQSMSSQFNLVFEIYNKFKTDIGKMRSNSYAELLKSVEKLIGPIIDAFTTPGPLDPVVIAANLFSELVDLITPFLEIEGMPEIPLIGELGPILEKLAKMAKIASKIGATRFGKDNKTIGEQLKEKDGELLDTAYDAVGKLLNDIADVIWHIIEMMPMIVEFFIVTFLMELLDMIKPVIDYFGLSLGPHMDLIYSLPQLFVILGAIYGGGKDAIKKIFIERFKNIYYAMLQMAGGGSNENIDTQLEYVMTEIETLKLQKEGAQLEMNALKLKERFDEESKTLDDLYVQRHKLVGDFDTAQNLSSNYQAATSGVGTFSDFFDVNRIRAELQYSPEKIKSINNKLESINRHSTIQNNLVNGAAFRLSVGEYNLEEFKNLSSTILESRISAIPDYINSDELLEKQREIYDSVNASKVETIESTIYSELGRL